MPLSKRGEPGRISCCVPHCRRTRKPDVKISEWICGVHWTSTSKIDRTRYRLFKRQWRAACADSWGGWKAAEAIEIRELADRYWELLKAEAIQRAAGIT